jgi:hypothetical protein
VNSNSATNLPASVRQRLLNKAKACNRPFNELLQYYSMERFLYRLSMSAHVDRFILKGALMLRVWRSPEARPTMDIDMLGRTSNDEDAIVAQIQDMLAVEVEPDGLVFDASTIQTERITEDADYRGIRVRFLGMLDSARVNIRIDIGFGDIIVPDPEISDLPTILDYPVPRLLCYSRESAIAEKFEAMIKLGELNSRMKDFYDIWLLSRQFDFDADMLAEAIAQTLETRRTILPDEISAFSEHFIEMKHVQWAAFRKRLRQDEVPTSFTEVAAGVKDFLSPFSVIPRTKAPTSTKWIAPGPWIPLIDNDNPDRS